MDIVRCKSCNAKMVWLKTVNGKNIPVDADTIWNKKAKIFDPDIMKTHFITCPHAKKWRKKK
jgi:hypothetical protein